MGLAPKDSALRQVIVKIKSKQSIAQLKRNAAGEGEEEVLPGGGEVKKLLEYLVLQRRIFKAVEGPWKIWGTVEETKPEEVLGKAVPEKHGLGGISTAK